MYPTTPDIKDLGTYETQIGKRVSLVLWYQSWKEGGQLKGFPTHQLDTVRQHGAIPVLAWEPDAYPAPGTGPQFPLAAIASGTWDSFLRDYATAAKAWGHPFFLRFASEMNGSWTPWSEFAPGNGAGQFVKAWRHVHDIFASVGATNVTWVWCPNIGDATTTPLAELYPGKSYVDWAGMDGYNYSVDLYAPWHSFDQVFRSTYTDLVKLLPPTTPIMIGETGTVENGGSKPAWIRDALTTQLPANFPRVKALIWFNASDGKFNLRVDTSPQSLAAFRSAIALDTYQANKYAQLDQSPIPSPEQIVLRPPSPTATVPVSENVFGGPAPGTVQVIDAARGLPVRGATLVYLSGTTAKTDTHGLSMIPKRDPPIVLEQITVGVLVVPLQLKVDPQRGYVVAVCSLRAECRSDSACKRREYATMPPCKRDREWILDPEPGPAPESTTAAIQLSVSPRESGWVVADS